MGGIISFFHSIFHNFSFHDNKGGNSTNPAAHYLRQFSVFPGEVRHFFFFSFKKFIIQWKKSEAKIIKVKPLFGNRVYFVKNTY